MREGDSRRSTLVQALPQAGWECPVDRPQQIDRLWALLRASHPEVNEAVARQRFAILLITARRLLQLGMPDGKKPTTWLRGQITGFLALPQAQALAILQEPYPVLPAGDHPVDGEDAEPVRLLAHYLDLHIEAEDPTFQPDRLVRPEHLEELGGRRYALLLQHGADLTPVSAPGREAIWGNIAALVAEALDDLTGERPVRSVGWDGEREGQEGGWGLEFFRAFADLITLPAPEPSAQPSQGPPPVPASDEGTATRDSGFKMAKIWRRALERQPRQGVCPVADAGDSGPNSSRRSGPGK